MVIQHNLFSMNANRMFNINVQDRARVSEKLSSGYRIHRAADDAAGLGISEKMRRQVRGLTQAVANAQDGISLLQSAEGALKEVHDMLQRMNELCVKGASDTLATSDRRYIQSEIACLTSEIDRAGETTTFNEIKLLNGSNRPGETSEDPLQIVLQIGSEATDEDELTIEINAVNAKTLGIQDLNVEGVSNEGALKGIKAIKNAIEINSKERSNLGSYQNRLEYTIKNLNNVIENTQAAESQLRDSEMAHTISDFINKDVLVQAGQMILAQANQSKEVVLRLLQ